MKQRTNTKNQAKDWCQKLSKKDYIRVIALQEAIEMSRMSG